MVRGARGLTALVSVALAVVTAGCGPEGGTGGGAQATPAADSGYASLEHVPEQLAADGTTITVGDPAAPFPLRLYEDPRCPYCAEFETTGGGPATRESLLTGTVRIDYTLASFLDDRLGGGGSARAVNALRAALEQDRFAEFHQVLYENQPEESVDGFTEKYLLELASRVDGLRGPEFDEAVRTMKYQDFVTASEKAYERAGGPQEPEGPGTPTMTVYGDAARDVRPEILFSPEAMRLFLATQARVARKGATAQS